METRHIFEFLVLADCLSFSEAAERLSLSQSTLSKHIKSLEAELGVSLFERTPRAVRLTPAGEAMAPYAKRIVSECEKALETLSTYEENANVLNLGAIRNMGFFHINEILIGFAKKYPEVSINIIEDDEERLLKLYNKKKINIYSAAEITCAEYNMPYLPVFYTDIVALITENDPLASEDSVSLEDLRGVPLLLPNNNSTPYQVILQEFEKAGITPKVIYEGYSSGAVDLVRAGMGVMLQIRNIANHLTGPSMKILPLSPAVDFRFGVTYRSPEAMNSADRKFLDFMETYTKGHEQDGS